MNILVLNRGSSSIKCCLYQFEEMPSHPLSPFWEASLQWKEDFDEPVLTVKNSTGAHYSEILHVDGPREGLKHLLTFLDHTKTAVLSSLDEIDIVGHRVVHGGREYSSSVAVNAHVKEAIRRFAELAPLHNLADLEGIEILEELCKDTPQIAVFDTAFHHTLPDAAKVYPVPYEWFEGSIQRYGFHGISFKYCAKRAENLLKCSLIGLKIVICHLGSGASLCAVADGKSIDTTMGFTPLEGLMMDTRSGTIDPGILLHMLGKGKATVEGLSKILYHGSGLLGISGATSDMRDIIEQIQKGDKRAVLAFDLYIHRLNSMLGSMVASLKGMDVLVFTAGIGENASLLRERVCETFAFLGVSLDKEKNVEIFQEDCLISDASSKIKVLVIRTQESFEIACECWHWRMDKRP